MIRKLIPRRLQVRLILLMTLVLFPLGLIAIWQTGQLAQSTRQISQDLLFEATDSAASDHRALIQRTVGAASGLGAMAFATDGETCRRTVRTFLSANPLFSFAGFIAANGIMTCSSDAAASVDLSGVGMVQDALARRDVSVAFQPEGTVFGEDVLIVSVPVFDGGMLAGLMSVSLRSDLLIAANGARPIQDGLSVAGITTAGDVLDLSAGGTGAVGSLPAGLDAGALRRRAGDTFVAQDGGGVTRMYSVQEAAQDAFVIVGSVPLDPRAGQGALGQMLAPALFAVLMWCASMAVAFVGLNRLVLRHLAALRSAMRQLALGERHGSGLVLSDAPEEFEDAARAFNRMALIITEAEAQHLTDLHDKEVLLREVHHRVKNNLQMIASIMNLQSRNAHTDEARGMLDSLKGRVRALATLHRSLYTETETSQVDARDLIAAVVSETEAMAPQPGMRIDSALDPVALYPDQAVPLSMWATEALTNAVKYASLPDSGAASIRVRMSVDEAGEVTLRIENGAGGAVSARAADSTGLGTVLMNAFCRQLGGVAEVETPEGLYINTLRFTVEAFQSDGASSERTHAAA